MNAFLAFTVVGIATGCIYALTATGLVVTYVTSGIFNFAHGAIGMVAAFAYWELTVEHHWPVPLALAFVLLVLAPAIGALTERLLMRNLHDASTEVQLVVTVGLMLCLIGVAQWRWQEGRPRIVPSFFAGHSLHIFDVAVSYHRVIVIVVAGGIALALRTFLFRTRIGVALRAVVDAPELASLYGVSPDRVRMLGWAVGASLAGLAGVLLAPLVTMDILTLTLLVINGFAAAIFGRLKSLPRTFVGGIALGLLEAYTVWKAPGHLLSQLRTTLPIIFGYVLLLALPHSRLRVGRSLSSRAVETTTLRRATTVAVAFVVVCALVVRQLSIANVFTMGRGLVYGLILLSLVVLTGYAGQVSLCQLTFVGFGAFAMGRVAGGGSWFGLIAAVALSAVVGAIVALPALRLQGLYLALITLAFAQAMTAVFFNNNHVFGQGGALHVGRLHLFGSWSTTDRGDVVVLALALAAAGVGVVALRRSAFGRRLAAMSDSPLACTTIGLSLVWTKLAAFMVAAGLAGLAGALYGGLNGSVGTNDFVVLGSLAVLLLLAIQGVDSVIGAVVAGITFALFPVVQSHIHSQVNLAYLLTGLGAISIGRSPQGSLRYAQDEIRRRLRARADAKTRATDILPASIAPRRAADHNGQGEPPPALELIGVRAGYGGIEALHGVDLVVPAGTVCALLGPNGAGKTTLLRVVSGVMTPTAGCVHIADVHVNGSSPEGLARLGVCTIPEGRGIFANLTVAENVRMMTYAGVHSVSDIEAEVYTRFPRLKDRRSQPAGTLSGGEQQMLALARAVGTRPALLLLDEISMGLAPIVVSDLYEVVAGLAEAGIAILVVEQFVRTAMAIAHYVAVMAQGRVVRVGEGVDVAGVVSAAYMGGVE